MEQPNRTDMPKMKGGKILRFVVAIFTLFAMSTALRTEPASAIGFVADYVIGQGGSYTTSGSGTTSTTLNGPRGSAVDTVNHRLFVPDAGNNRVLVYSLDANTGIPTSDTATHVLGQSNFTSSGTATSQSRMNNPVNLSFDAATQRLYVADTGNDRVLVFEVSSVSNGMNASYVIGKADFTSTGCNTNSSTTCSPHSVAVDSVNQRIYVSDFTDNRVLVFNTSSLSNGMAASYVLGQANFTSAGSATTQSGMNQPSGSSFDSTSSYLYIADSTNNRILVFNTSSLSNGMNASYVLGQANFTSSGTATTQSGMNGPRTVVVDLWNQFVYVADSNNNRVLGFDRGALSNGMNASSLIGPSDYTSATSGTSQMLFSSPRGLGASNGQLFVSDLSNNRVLMFTTSLNQGATASVAVEPTLTFTVSGKSSPCNFATPSVDSSSSSTALSLGRINSAQGTVAQEFTISTNAADGYRLYARTTAPLTGTSGHVIPNLPTVGDQGGWGALAAFPATGNEAFGFHMGWLGYDGWAGLLSSDTQVQHSNTPTTETQCIAFRAGTSSTTPAGMYSTTLIYTATAAY